MSPAVTDAACVPGRLRLRAKLWELFGADLRSLAALRIATGLIVIADLLNRLPNLTAHYTDRGVLPRSAMIEQFSSPYNISVHLISGQAWVQAILFACAALFAAAMVVGYRTRLMTAASWFMLLSLHTRNSMVLDSGDSLLRMLLFWSIFLPTGVRWSLDSMMGRTTCVSNQFISVASFALLLQVCVVYVLSALFKDDPVWQDGYAIFYALQIDQFATPLGHWMLRFPTLLRGMTFFVLYLELLGPVLVFSPIFTWRIRTLAVVAFWLVHAGMSASLELGHFPYICAAAWLVFLPGQLLDLLEARAWFRWLVRRAARMFDGMRPYFERLYSNRPARPVLPGLSFVNNSIAMFFLLFVTMWNLRSYNVQDYGYFFPDTLKWIAGITRVDQKWNMFSPRPMTEDGWYVIPAKLLNGREVNLFTGGPVVWEKPSCVSKTYPDTRWRKYMLNLWSSDSAGHRLYYARYLARQWNDTHEGDEKAETFEIIFMRQDTTADGRRPTPQKVRIWQHWCFK